MAERAPAFFRYHYDKVVLILIFIILGLLVTASVVMYQVYHRPLPPFYAISAQGNRMELKSSGSPILLPEVITTWASKAAVAAYTFDFVNYEDQIKAVRPYFTEAGWNSYTSAVSGLISSITQNQLFTNGVVSGPPVIANQGELPGRGYVWRIQIPFLVTYQTGDQTTKSSYTVIITIVRVPTSQNPKGIGIDELVMRG